MSQLLDQHRWKDRVVLLFAEDAQQPALNQQLALFEEARPGMNDRDLVIYQVFRNRVKRPNGKTLEAGKAAVFRSRYGVPEKVYTCLLIGKDGTVKLKDEEVVSIERLFGLIDSMPMRKAEMRRQKEKEGG